jgi:hypothetical protein
MRIRSPLAAGLMAVLGLALPTAASARPAGFHRLMAGRAATGGTFDVSARRGRLQGVKGVCIALDAKLPDGSKPGAGIGCAYGALKATGGVLPIGSSSITGSTRTSSLIGGLVDSRARTVRVRFADGTRIAVRTHRPPKGYRRLLGSRVRVYGASVLGRTTSTPKHTSGYDRHGHRVARATHG